MIVDYGMGNLHSVRRRMAAVGADPVVTADPKAIAAAERLVLPGVGHFGRAMDALTGSGLRGALEEAVLTRGAPILGICLGMQLLARYSEEGNAAGLAWLDARVVRFKPRDTLRFKVPHMGWNSVRPLGDSALFHGIGPENDFCFVHAYHLICDDPSDVAAVTEYEHEFPSAVARGNIFGTQFHPEKSHGAGRALLDNFMRL